MDLFSNIPFLSSPLKTPAILSHEIKYIRLAMTSKIILSILVLILSISPLHAENGGKSEKQSEKALRFVPLLTSTPLTGTGVGAAASYLYKAENNSSMSQLQVGGQYSNNYSTTFFIRNNAFFNNNTLISNTAILPAKTNSEFTDSEGTEVKYQIKSKLFEQKLLYKVLPNTYVGGRIFYKDLLYTGNNYAGEDFIYNNGIMDEKSFGVGISASLDNRKNKYYPRKAYFVDFDINTNPSALGTENSYNTAVVNARYYAAGFNKGDVWAWQYYGQFSSDETPDSGLATLSGKSVLRGYPAGQFKARFLNGTQTEYRYPLVGTAYKLTAFVGAAKLHGGSFGEEGRSRNDDGWYYASGLGIRYAIQKKTGVDLRIDFVNNSEGDQSLYVTMNQAF